jgi:hypothetical protein
MSKNNFKAVKMVRDIRNMHYDQLKGKSEDERIAFYRKKSKKIHNEVKMIKSDK